VDDVELRSYASEDYRFQACLNGTLGDEYSISGGKRQDFEGDSMYWDEKTRQCGTTPLTPPVVPGGGGLCADPRTQSVMDEWLMRANPPENLQSGWNVHYDTWGRLVGRTPHTTLAGLPQGVDTRLTRCQYLWSIAATLGSTNLGTQKQYVEQRIR
jgi:hypothetical protein